MQARRRSRLLNTSAMGALALAVLWAAPAQAQLVQGASPAQSNGTAPVINQAGAVTDVTLGGSRTVIDWDKFDINSGDTANFVFANRSDIVLNRVSGAGSTINGNLNGTIGAGGSAGGNIWIYNANGVVIGADARISTGGLLVTAAAMDRADDSGAGGFLDGSSTSFNFSGAYDGTRIDVRTGAQVDTHGGALALISPIVNTEAGSTLTASDGGNVLYGSASSYKVSFRPTSNNDLDLLSFEVASGADGAGGYGGTVYLQGDTSGNRVFVSMVSQSGLMSQLFTTGNIQATNAVADETGAIVLTTNHNIVNGAVSASAVAGAGNATFTTGPLAGPDVSLVATGTLLLAGAITATGDVNLVSETGNIHQNGEVITANTLSASAAGYVWLDSTTNDVAKINGLSSSGGGGIGFAGTSYEIAGPITTTSGVGLSSSGTISGTGLITAANFSINGAGSIHVGGTANLAYSISSGDLTIQATGDINLTDGWALYGHTLSLISDTGSIVQSNNPFYYGGTIIADAANTIDLGQANNIYAFTGASNAGDISVKTIGGLTFDVNTPGNVTIDAGGVAVATTDLRAGTLGVSAGNYISLIADTLDIGSYRYLTSTGSGIQIATDSTINIGGNFTAASGADVNLASNAGAINQTAGTMSGRQILLSATGSITQDSNAGIVASTYVDAEAGGDLLLAGANDFGSSAPLLAAGSGRDVTIRSLDSFNYNSGGATVGTLRLISDTGSIGQVRGTDITASQLYAEANGGIEFWGGDDNQIGKLLGLRSNDTSNPGSDTIIFFSGIGTEIAGDIVTSGEINLAIVGAVSGSGTLRASNYVIGAAGTLNLDSAGIVSYLRPNGGNLTLNSNGDLTLALTSSLPNPINLVTLNAASGAIRQTGGAGLVGSVVANAAGAIDLSGANNFATLNATSTGGGAITVNTVNSFVFAAHTAGAATITAGGDASGTGAGAIDVGTLKVTAGGVIDINFTGGGVTYGQLSAGGSIAIAMDGNLLLGDDVTAGPSGSVSLTSRNGTIGQSSGATIHSTNLSLISGGNVTLGEANNFTTLAELAVGGDLTLRNLGSIDLSPILGGTGWYSSGGALTLVSDTGNIRSSNAGIITSRLTANAGGSITLDGTIASLGNVTAGGGILLTTYNGTMDLTGNVTGTNVSIYADTGVSQSGGIIDTGRLNVITNGAISLTGANQIDVVGRLDTDRYDSGIGYDVTLRNSGAILFDYLVEAPGGTVTLTADSGGISQTGFSIITAGTLKASAVGDIVFDQSSNNVAHLGATRSSTGAVTYVDADDFDITGPVDAVGALSLTGGVITTNGGLISAGGVVNVSASSANLIATGNIKLGAIGTSGDFAIDTTGGITLTGAINVATLSLAAGSGDITQLASSSVRATMLNASASGNVYFEQVFNAITNVITNVGAITVGNNFTLSSNSATNLTGVIAAGATGTVRLRTNGSITQTGGGITAGSLSVASGNTATLDSSTNDVDKLVNFQANSGTYRDADGFDLVGSTLVGNLSLVAGGAGAITQTGEVGAITLNATAGGAITLGGGGNHVSNLGTLSAGGALVFANQDNFNLTGNITAANGDLTLRSNTGGINQTGGSVTASGLSVYAAAGITLDRTTNNVATINEITVGTGNLSFHDADGFGIAGNINAAGRNVSLSVAGSSGAIDQTAGTITGAGVTLSAPGAISQSGSARIVTSALLDISAGDDLLLGGANDFASINIGYGSGTNVTIRNAGSLDLGTLATSVGALNLVSDSSYVSVSSVAATNVTGSAGAYFAVSGSFGQAGTIAATSAILLDSSAGLTLYGDLSALAVDLRAAGGGITQSAGAITANRLNFSAAGDITLGRNFVDGLGTVSAGGGFFATDIYGLSPSGTLELAGDITVGGSLYLTNHSNIIQTSGRISAANLEFTANGTITASGDNIVTGATRFNGGNVTYRSVGDINLQISTIGTASITSTGAVRFGGVGDSLAGTISIDATGGISIADHGVNFTNLGTVINRTSGGISLTNSGALNLTGDVTAAGQTVSLATTTGSLLQNAGVVTADTLNLSSGLQIKFSNAPNNVAKLGVVNGPSQAIFRNSGDLELTGNITSYNAGLSSDSGSISQTGGAITASYLFFEALNGDVTATGANHAAMYVTGNVGGGFTYNDIGALTIINVTALEQFRVTAAGSITQTGGRLTTADLHLTSTAGTVWQSGGTIDATDIAIQAATGIDLSGANEIDGGAGLSTAAGDILFRNTGSIALGGNVILASTPGALTLISDAGSITQSVAIDAASFTASAALGITLTNANNAIDSITGLGNSGTGGITLINGGSLALDGNVTAAGQTVQLGATGSLTQSGGGITASGLGADATTGIALTSATNDVATITRLTNTTSGGIAYTDANGFHIAGDITAAGQALSLAMVDANAYVAQNGTSAITAGTLNLSGDGVFTLRGYGGSGNHFAAIGNVSSTVELRTIGDVDLTGTIVSPYFELSVQGGNITQSGGRIENSTSGNYLGLQANNISLTSSTNQLGDNIYLIANAFGAVAAVSTGNTKFASLSGGATSVTVTGGNLTSNVGGLNVNSLTASGSGAISLDGRIGALGNVTAGGDSSLRSTSSLALTGDVDVGAYVLGLASSGAITQSGGTITTGRLNANAATSITIGAVTGATLHADLTAGTDINLSFSGALDILGLTAPGTVTLTADSISQSAAINVGTLGATGQIIAFVDTANLIGAVGDVTASGSGLVNITDADGFDVIGNLNASGTIALSAGGTGSIRQTGGTITTVAAGLSAGGNISLDRANAIDQFTVSNAGGAAVTLRNAGTLTVAGINAPDALVTLTSDTGNIVQAGGAGNEITASKLVATAATGISLGGANDVDSIGALMTTAGGISFTAAGALALEGDVTSVDAVTFFAGSLTQTGGIITASQLFAYTTGSAMLGNANDIGSVSASAFVAGGDITFRSINAILLDDTQTDGTLSLISDNGGITQTHAFRAARLDAQAAGNLHLAYDNNVTALGTLNVGGQINYQSISAYQLAGDIDADHVSLVSYNGSITQASGRIAANSFETSAGAGLTLGGANDVGTIGVLNGNAGDVIFRNRGNVALPGIAAGAGHTYTITSDEGAITQNGALTIGTLNLNAATGITLQNAGNNVAALGDVTNSISGGFTFHNAPGIVLQGDVVAAGQTVSLDAVSMADGGTITADTLNATTTGGDIDLAGVAHHVANLGTISASGDLRIRNADAANITGTVSGSSVILTAPSITETGAGRIAAGDLTILGDGDPAHDYQLGGDNAVAALVLNNIAGAIHFRSVGDLVLGFAGGGVQMGGGLSIVSDGQVSQSGAIVTGTLSVDAQTGIALGDSANQVAAFGALSTVLGDIELGNGNGIQLIGAVTTPGILTLNAFNGGVTQLTAAPAITAAQVTGFAGNGDFSLLGSQNAILGLGTASGANVAVTTATALGIDGVVTTELFGRLALKAGGDITQGSNGKLAATRLDVDTQGAALLDGNNVNSIAELGDVAASSLDLRVDGQLYLSGTVQAGSVSLTSPGAIIDMGGDLTAGSFTVNAASLDMGSAISSVDMLSANVAGDLTFASSNSLLLDLGAGGRATVSTAGALTVASSGVLAGGAVSLTAADTITSNYVIQGDTAVSLDADNGMTLVSISAGDDLSLNSNAGAVTVRGIDAGWNADSNADGHNFAVSGQSVTIGADDAASISSTNTLSAAGAGTFRYIQASDALAINIDSMTGSLDALATGPGNLSAMVLNGALNLLAVQGQDVSLIAANGAINVDDLTVDQDYFLSGQDFSAGALDLSNSITVRDVAVGDTDGDLAFSGVLSAGRDLIVNSVGAVTGGGSFGALGDLTINAANGISADQVGAGHDLILDGGAGDVSANLMLVQNDYTLRGAEFFGAALSPVGARAGTWTMNTGASIDLAGQSAEYANTAFNVGAIHNGTIRATAGNLTLAGDHAYDLSMLEATGAIQIDLTDNLSVFQMLAGGGIGFTGDSIDNGGSIEAGGAVNISAGAYAQLGWVSAGGDMRVDADSGDLALVQANLTGATGNLALTALNGNVQLGAADEFGIGSDNVFTRVAGSTGTAMFTGNSISVYLDGAADLTDLRGDTASVVVANGDLTIGSLTTDVGDAYVEAYDGALTIGTVQSAGAIDLYSTGGGLTLTGSLHSGDVTYLGSDGLIDLSHASSVESGDYFEITGASVLAGTLVSHDALIVSATDGGVTADQLTADYSLGVIASGAVRIGQADSQDVIAIIGDTVTLRGASTPYGMSILAEGDVLVGADTEMLIGSANTLVLGNCGCGGASIVSNSGGVTLNLSSVTGGFAEIGSAIDRDVSVVVANGDLIIGDLAGYNITAKALDGVLDIDNPVSSGGNYTLVANDFAGNALSPTVMFAAGVQDILITDLTGGLNIAGGLQALGNIHVTAIDGALSMGAVTTTGGAITLAGTAIQVTSATALDRIALASTTGGITLGAASLTGTGANSLELTSDGDIMLGAATPGGIGASNSFNSAGDTASVITTGGTISINLNDSAALGTIRGDQSVAITIGTGDLLVDGITTNGNLDLAAGGGIAQGAAWSGGMLSVSAGDDVLLREANMIGSLGAVMVANGDFALRTLGALPLTGAILVADGTVELHANGAITQTNAAAISASRFSGTTNGAAVTLGAANRIETLGDFGAGSFLLNNERLLTIDGTVNGSGSVTIRALGGMTISVNGSVISGATGDAIVLASDGTFTNLAGAAALQAGGRWLVYSQAQGDPAGSTAANDFGGLAGRSFYGSAYDFTSGAFAVAPSAGNRFVYAYRPVLAVAPDNLTVTYDGQIPALTATIHGLINGDLAADAWSGDPLIAGATSRNAGTYALTASLGSLASDMNYDFAFGTGTLRIDPRAITAALIANDRIYDRTTDATGALSLTGAVAGDAVDVSGTLAFDNRNAGSGRVVTASGIALSGADAGNYTINATATDLADIFARAITATLTANDRIYDRSTDATGSLALNGVIAGDTVDATGNLAFDSRNAGTRTVTASGITLSGADAGNYTINIDVTDLADIFARAITATFTANDRTYDGTTGATGTIALTGVLAGDGVTASGALTFDNRNAGAGHVATASGIALGGADAGNYSVNVSATDLADIFARAITATLTANDRTYDRTTDATGTFALNGVVAGDDVGASGTLAFGSGNAGTQTVTASGIALGGADAGNYTVNVSATDLADIFARAITATLTANDRVYDGTTSATGTLALDGVIAGDTVGATAGIVFDSKNAGNRTATATGLALTGADAANYTVTGTASDTATIARLGVTGTASADNRAYDGTTATTGRITINGVLAGDTLSASAGYAFTNANAGAGRTVTVSGATLGGADAGNYTLTLGAGPVLADILRRGVTVAADDNGKILGQPDPVLSFRLTSGSLVAGDNFAGGVARAAGEQAGTYAIGRGTLALSANYDLTVIPASFVISFLSSGADAVDALKLLQPGGFSLDQDPSANLAGDDDSGEE